LVATEQLSDGSELSCFGHKESVSIGAYVGGC
jgi:hypothetical protein